jgi:sugar O-acyltransferase (sialic acid O-acetyltransferase NeuD family)
VDIARLKSGDPAVIVGTSGFAVELAGLISEAGIKVRGCIGPDAPPPASGLHYLGGDQMIGTLLDSPFLVAIGVPELRKKLFDRITASGGRVGTFIDPAAYVSSTASIGEGALVYPNATVHAGATLARGVVVNSNATIGHETSLGEFVTVGPGASLGGRMRVGDGVYFGIGASALEEVTIAAGSIIGAGAVVVKDCLPAGTYVGIPAARKSS